MAYASTSSPFAAVKGQNVFSSSKIPISSPIPSKFSTDLAQSASLPSKITAPKRSGFEAFASSASPFASVTRTKSPVLGSAFKLGKAKSPPPRRVIPAVTTSAFASYAGSNHGFTGLSAHKRQRADSPNGSGPNSPVRMAIPVIDVLGGTRGRFRSSGDEADGDDDDDEQPQSFSEKLRAAKDDEDLDNEDDEKLRLTEQDGISLSSS